MFVLVENAQQKWGCVISGQLMQVENALNEQNNTKNVHRTLLTHGRCKTC